MEPTDIATVGQAAHDVYRVARAGSQVRMEVVAEATGEYIHMFGNRAARTDLGMVEMTNRILPENVGNVFVGAGEMAMRSARSGGTLIGLALGLVDNGADYLSGQTDRYHFAAALTVDTGVTIGGAMLAGAIAGGVAGAIAGAPGLGIGAIPGAVIGGVSGALVAGGLAIAFNLTGARDYTVNRVADLYRGWVER